MKNLVDLIKEDKNMFNLVQNETSREGTYAYSTFDYSDCKDNKGIKAGWVVINDDQEFVSITAAEDYRDFDDYLGLKEEDGKKLFAMKKHDTLVVNDELWVRLW